MLAGEEAAADGDVACCGAVPPAAPAAPVPLAPGPDADGEAEPEADGVADGPLRPGIELTGLAVLVGLAAGDEPEKVPVLAASATPPPAVTASAAAMTFTVRILASGDFIICSLRESATDAR